MFATAFHTSRHYILFTVMACLCVLLGGPSYAAGAESLFIAGATYYESGASGPGWAWTNNDHLELTGYEGEAIGADDDLVVTLTGHYTVVETSAPDVDISRCGMEVWGDLTLRGTGSLVATGSQCGIYVSGTLAVEDCKVDARASRTRGWPARSRTVLPFAAVGALSPRARAPGRTCAPMVCVCWAGLLAVARPGSLPSMRPGWMRRAPTAASPARVDRLHPRALWRLRAGPLAQAAWWMPTDPWQRV